MVARRIAKLRERAIRIGKIARGIGKRVQECGRVCEGLRATTETNPEADETLSALLHRVFETHQKSVG